MPSHYFPELPELLARRSYEAIISGGDFHHLVRVSRHKKGDKVLLNSGRGVMAEAEILSIGKHEARLAIGSVTEAVPFPAPFAIAFALLKNRRDENILEKCTELGAGEFFPINADYGVHRSNEGTMERFHKVTLAAIKQCDNPFLPVVNPVMDLRTAIMAIREKGYMPVLCSERRPDVWLDGIGSESVHRPCFIVGPEGGFSAQEFALALDEGVPEVSLSYLITRADTAAIAIAAQWLIYTNKERMGGTT